MGVLIVVGLTIEICSIGMDDHIGSLVTIGQIVEGYSGLLHRRRRNDRKSKIALMSYFLQSFSRFVEIFFGFPADVVIIAPCNVNGPRND